MSTSSVAIAVQSRREAALARLADYAQLAKLRIAALELVVVAVAMYVAASGPVDVVLVVATLVGTTLVAASASAANQWLERETDVRMARTESRPLPAGRLTSREVLAFTAGTLTGGVFLLAAFVNAISVAVAVLTWLLYVAAYTPLKRLSPSNTAVGAVAGALPVAIGWTAVDGPWDLRLAALVMILFLWQFPHFMAIAWLYRREYAGAGIKMLTVVDPTGLRAGYQSVLAAAMLLPISLLPVGLVNGLPPGWLAYVAWAVLLGACQLALSVRFLVRRDEDSARLLLRASLIYLPSLLTVLVVAHGVV
jgi:protoheme IX farnesyltransferase